MRKNDSRRPATVPVSAVGSAATFAPRTRTRKESPGRTCGGTSSSAGALDDAEARVRFDDRSGEDAFTPAGTARAHTAAAIIVNRTPRPVMVGRDPDDFSAWREVLVTLPC